MSKEQADGYFGLCPHCRNNDGYVNIGRGHWFVCDEHKVMWFIGSNLFSSWKDQTEEEQERAFYARGLDQYSRIDEPYYPPQEDMTAHEQYSACVAQEQDRWQAVLDTADRLDREHGVSLRFVMTELAKHFDHIPNNVATSNDSEAEFSAYAVAHLVNALVRRASPGR
jgi:hypothetical protein